MSKTKSGGKTVGGSEKFRYGSENFATIAKKTKFRKIKKKIEK